MADIVLKDRNGNNIEYPGVNHIKVKTTDGATKDFIARTPVETTVDLDFSGGAMEVNPEAEELFSKVNIPVPENLNPENIAEGVDIAGIIGTLTGGGGCVCSGGSFTGTASQLYTLEHNMGVVPDFIMLYQLNNPTSGNYSLPGISFATSDKGKEVLGYNRYGSYKRGNGSSGSSAHQPNPVTYADSTGGWATQATETTIVIGNTSGSVTYGPYSTCHWLAIGGLT